MFENKSESPGESPGIATLERPESCRDENTPSAMHQKLNTSDIAILVAGTAVPGAAIAMVALNNLVMGTEMVLRHPLETLIQYGIVLTIPIGNYVVWQRLKQRNRANAIRTGLLNGLAAGASILVLAGCIAACALGYPAIDSNFINHQSEYAICAMLTFCALVASLRLMQMLCLIWETDGARTSQLIYSLAGVLLSLLAVGASEARQVAVRVNEKAALAEEGDKRTEALKNLRNPLLDSAQELKRDIAAPRSGGLSGLFLGVNDSSSRQLYFALTSQPYEAITDLAVDDQANDTLTSSSYDNFLARQVVGEAIKGFSLKRSQLSGLINARSLTANLSWTFVLKNGSSTAQEARAEIALPPGAVVSNMTLWIDGKPVDATITSTTQARGAYTEVVTGRRDPALITYLGKGRVLVQCYPVMPGKETKVSLSMAAPLKLDSGTKSSLTLPRLVASNFSAGKSHSLRFNSAEELSLAAAGLKEMKSLSSSHLYVGEMKEQDQKNTGLSLCASRPMTLGAFAAQDKVYGGYAVETVKEVANQAPKNLVVVIDGSSKAKEYKKDLTEMLKRVAKMMPTTVLLADNDQLDGPEAVSVEKAIKKLNESSFEGGHDNLPAVVKAAEIAGDQEQPAVLWVHGPQPAFNEEIYITTQGASKPAYYELALDDGWTNSSQFFKNHRDIGPMTPVLRSGNLASDLNRFLEQWQPGGHHYSVQLFKMNEKPDCTIVTGQEALDLSTLVAAQTCKQLLTNRNLSAAGQLAVNYHIVSPLTSGVVLENQSDYQRWGIQQNEPSRLNRQNREAARLANGDSLSGFGTAEQTATGAIAIASSGDTFSFAPVLQGATSGTISPQGVESTVVQGVNTAGTVRVNNLADIEALLNVLANGIAMIGSILGLTTIVKACLRGFQPKSFVIGLSMIVFGLATPGVINWLVATARDSALFN
ncbi:MAG: hypothetical protein HY986_13565 [Candidatus Melainabacteria bacterium]|nr:hypothetical protein [Candidatus Melainabacteria bacterium]